MNVKWFLRADRAPIEAFGTASPASPSAFVEAVDSTKHPTMRRMVRKTMEKIIDIYPRRFELIGMFSSMI